MTSLMMENVASVAIIIIIIATEATFSIIRDVIK